MKFRFTAEATLVKPTKTFGLKMARKALKGDFDIDDSEKPMTKTDRKLKKALSNHFLQKFPTFHDVMELNITELVKI